MRVVRRKGKKKVIIISLIAMILWGAAWYMFNTYKQEDVKEGTYTVTRVQSTEYSENVDKLEEKSKSLADIIEDLTRKYSWNF